MNTSAAPAPTTHDVTIRTTKKYAQARVMGVPPEEVGLERAARSIADCNYFYHEVVTKTESQLIEEGFDADQIRALTEYTGINDLETVERDTVGEHQIITGQDSVNPAARLVRITEHYVRMDYDGTGPKMYLVITGGDQGKVLKKDGKDCISPFDAIPFAGATPVPQPHRFIGRSIADLVLEIQREKTAIKRAILDNLYLALNPRVEVAEAMSGPNTLDDLLVVRPGGLVRTKQPGGITFQQIPDMTAAAYPALQYLDADLESKTGLAKQTQGIDANALQNQSATAVAQVFSASQMRIKLIARLLAEGVKDMFALLHATIRKHGQQAATVRLRNQWVNVDPRNWKTRDDMTIHVGLGTGGKAQQFAQTMALANVQKEFIAGGKGHMATDENLFNMASELAKIMGHKNPDRFFSDPTAKNPQTGQLLHPPLPPPQDPKVQIEAMKAQNEQQATQQKAVLEKQKADNDAQHQLIKTQAEIQLEREKAELEAQLKLIEAKLKQEEAQQKLAHEHEIHSMKMDQARAQSHQAGQQHEQTMQSKAADSIRSAQDHEQKAKQADQQHKASMEATKAKTEPAKPEKPATIEFVYDKAGKISHVKKNGNVQTVQRNAHGKMVKLQ